MMEGYRPTQEEKNAFDKYLRMFKKIKKVVVSCN